MNKLNRDRAIVLSWTVAFLVFMIAKDYVSAGILAVLGMILALKEAIWPTNYE